MSHYALTAVGPDQPGVLAAMTEPLVRLSCNLEDSGATMLRGHFALMMIVRAPDDVTTEAVIREVEGSCRELDVRVEVRELPAGLTPNPQPTHVLSVYGADRPGIVHRTARFLGRRRINLTDLDSRLAGRSGRPVYAMLLEIAVPGDLDEGSLRADLAELALELGVDASLRPIEER